jgi:hypothetical protein
MPQFYVSDSVSAARCKRSRLDRKPIWISGTDVSRAHMKRYNGVVQSVEDDGLTSGAGRRWKVTIPDLN